MATKKLKKIQHPWSSDVYEIASDTVKVTSSTDKTYLVGTTTAPSSTAQDLSAVGNSNIFTQSGNTIVSPRILTSGAINRSDDSLAIGSGAKSYCMGGVAEGGDTWAGTITSTGAYGYGGHAEGYHTVSAGLRAHAEGYGTIAIGASSHTEGQGSEGTDWWMDFDDNFLIVLTNGSTSATVTHGSNSKDLRKVTSSGTTYDLISVGDIIRVNGCAVKVTAVGTTTNNQCTLTIGKWLASSITIKNSSTVSSGVTKLSELNNLGDSNRFMVFRNCISSDVAAHSEGRSVAEGKYSHSEGLYTYASAQSAHAEGDSTNKKGIKASGQGAHAEGSATSTGTIIASGRGAHAEGFAYEGTLTASGYAAHAEGRNTTASGNYSHAGGMDTIADKEAMTAIGKYNAAASSGDLFAVGNGTSTSERSTALTVNSNGTTTLSDLVIKNSSPTLIFLRGTLSDTTIDHRLQSASGTLSFDYNASGTWNNLLKLSTTSISVYKTVYPASGISLGASTDRWSNVYSLAGNFSGKVTAESFSLSTDLSWTNSFRAVPFCKNSDNTSLRLYKTGFEFNPNTETLKSTNYLVKGGNIKVETSSSTAGCTMTYDATEECMKFTFN